MTEDLMVYGSDTTRTPTTMQDMMVFMKQQADSVGDLVDSLLWQPNKTYEAKQIVYSPNIPAGYVAICKQQGQSGANEPLWTVGVKSYSDGTCKWEISLSGSGGDGIGIGMIIPYAGSGQLPAGYLLCNGASVNKNTYSDLFDAIGYTYGGSGENFNLPNLIERFIEGDDVAGQYKDAGLPNIEGEFQSRGHARNQNYNGALTDGSGAFEHIRRGGGYGDNGVAEGSVASTNDKMLFNASRSNPIYGNSDTVQPKSLTIRYIIKAFAGASKDIKDVTITEVLNGLARVSNDLARLGDVEDTIVETYQSGGYWYRLYKSGWIEQGAVLDHGSNARSVDGYINWLVRFSDLSYIVFLTPEREGAGNRCMAFGFSEKNLVNIHVNAYGPGSASDMCRYIQAYACGYAQVETPTTYTLKVNRYETRRQTITTKVNNVTYMNEQVLTVYEGDVVTITTGGNWDYTGSVIINGTNQNTTSVTFTVSGDVIVTTTQPSDEDINYGGDGNN